MNYENSFLVTLEMPMVSDWAGADRNVCDDMSLAGLNVHSSTPRNFLTELEVYTFLQPLSTIIIAK